MDDIWESPREATPHLCMEELSQTGASSPRMARTGATTPRMDVDSFTFNWLLAELDRAHHRELQQALTTRSLLPLAVQGQRSPIIKGYDLIFHEAREDTTSNLAQYQRNLLLVTPENTTTPLPPPNPVPQVISTPRTPPTDSTPRQTAFAEDIAGETVGNPKSSTSSSSINIQRKGRESTLSLPRRVLSQSNSLVKIFNIGGQEMETGDQNCLPRLTRLLQREEFDFVIAVAITMNALVMCCECQYVGLDIGFNLQYPGQLRKAQASWPGAETTFTLLDWLFGILFLLEMVMKLICFRSKYFILIKRNLQGEWKLPLTPCSWSLQGWNMLDFLCVLAFLFDKIFASSAVNPQMFRLLRSFRLFRLVRLLKFLETMDHLYIMTTAIAGLSKVLGWAIMLLTIMLLTCNLALVQILQVTYFDQVTVSDLSDDAQLKKHHQMYAYFGTCTRGMLSMFEITLGNWPPVAWLLTEEVSEWFTLVCVLHKLTIGFAVIGVITGIILQETFKVAQTDDVIMYRQKKKGSNVLRRKMKTLFCTLDEEGDGKLSLSEFMSLGDDPWIKTWLASLEIETDDLKTLFELIDADGGGYITCDELVSRTPRIKGAARGIDVLAMRKELAQCISRMEQTL